MRDKLTTSEEWPLTARHQRRNMALYVICAGLAYLSAPVVYVGMVEVSLCDALGASNTVANLPSAAFYCFLIAPLFIAWRFHTARAIKPVLVCSYLIAALAGLVVAVVLSLPTTTTIRIAAVVLYGGAIGGSTAVISTFLWEMVSRGISPRRRGLTFALAYGFGPLLAVLGSLGAQLVLSGELVIPEFSARDGLALSTVYVSKFPFPQNFAIVFAATAPLLGLGAFFATQYVLPTTTEAEQDRPTFVGGLIQSGQHFLGDSVLRTVMTAYLLVGAGSAVVTIMALYTPEALGRPAADFAGYQNAIRFAFKMSAGLFLGWLLVRTHAKTGVLATAGFCFTGVMWVLLFPRAWFLLCFGFMGAGDLYGVYFPNYVMNRSAPNKVRHNIAYMQFLGLPISATPAVFGAISDVYGPRVSFIVAAILLASAIVLVILRLPPQPEPFDESPPPK